MVRVERRFGPSSAMITYSCGPAHRASTCTSSSTGTTPSTCCRSPSRSTSWPTTATCGIQFGAVARPTHRSTSWDAAKFEVCAHRYVDVAEPSFGVAVLNDGRYGHALFDGAVRVSLARAARYPDPDPDKGRHEVTISLFPHGPGAGRRGRRGRALDLPARAFDGGRAAGLAPPPIRVTGAGVEVDAVKLADDGSGDLDRPAPRGVRRPHAGQRPGRRADHRRVTVQPARGARRRLRGERRDRRPHPAPVRAGDPPSQSPDLNLHLAVQRRMDGRHVDGENVCQHSG